MVFERLPVFDEFTVIDQLDGDRELLFEILGLHRETIQDCLALLLEMTPEHPSFHEIASRIADTAERIHATRLAELAQLLICRGPDIELPRSARARLIRETERFLRETSSLI